MGDFKIAGNYPVNPDQGIDYGRGVTNVDPDTGIRYGIIPAHEVPYWWDESEIYCPPPTCPDCGGEVSVDDEICPHCENDIVDEIVYGESNGVCFVDLPDLKAESHEDGDIWVFKSDFFTYAKHCSPCAPGACYIMDQIEPDESFSKCYCMGHGWFEGGKSPYRVFRVETGEEVVK